MGVRLRSRGPLLFSITIFFLAVSYYFYAQCVYPVNRSFFIIGYGVLCLASIIFLALYILRSKTYNHYMGTRESWLQAHLYTGIIAVAGMFLHFDFKPVGAFGLFLTVLFFLVVINGVIGSLIYWYVPLVLTKYGRPILSEEEIRVSLDVYLEEADKLVSGTSDELRKVYDNKIRPFLRSKRTMWKYVLMTEREVLGKRRETIEKCKTDVPGRDVHDLLILGNILTDKEKLSFMQVKLKALRAWLCFHAPLTLALLVAIVIHIWTILYY